MMGSDSIDFGLKNLYKSWFNYRKGKKPNIEIDAFQYNLEEELFRLHKELTDRTYNHGGYRKFTVCDNKKREISVALVRDRVVHRLIYDYLTPIYDKTFIYDAWSCRIEKGLLGAIERIQKFSRKNPHSYVWKVDVKKFFDNVDHDILKRILSLRIHDNDAVWLLREIIDSYTKGMPIGNLTSQIFANIYLNELDRLIKNKLKVNNYVRYGDDFVVFEKNLRKLKYFKNKVTIFLENELKLKLNPKCDKIIKTSCGLKVLGIKVWFNGRNINKRNIKRINTRLSLKNVSSYYGLIKKHGNLRMIKYFDWSILDI